MIKNPLIEFKKRLENILPREKLHTILDSFSQKKPVAFRVNTLKTTIDDVILQLEKNHFDFQKVAWLPFAFTIPHSQRDLLTHHNLFLNGEIYIQSLASQLPVIALDPHPHEEILDLTAAPGSKTTQIAAYMQNTGRLAAVEMAKDRFFRLKANAAAQGATNIEFYLKDGSRVGKACPARFDRVLLDAPCSSEGRFNFDDPKSYAYWSFKKIKAMQKKQWTLLQSAFDALKPGGTLVYSTCTFAPEENEMMIQRLLNMFPDKINILPIDITIPEKNKMHGLIQFDENHFDQSLQNTVRILPDETMDGFFVAKMRKNATL